MSNARRKKKPIDKFFYRISLFKKKENTHTYTIITGLKKKQNTPI
jgi:hypothetical protein